MMIELYCRRWGGEFTNGGTSHRNAEAKGFWNNGFSVPKTSLVTSPIPLQDAANPRGSLELTQEVQIGSSTRCMWSCNNATRPVYPAEMDASIWTSSTFRTAFSARIGPQSLIGQTFRTSSASYRCVIPCTSPVDSLETRMSCSIASAMLAGCASTRDFLARLDGL